MFNFNSFTILLVKDLKKSIFYFYTYALVSGFIYVVLENHLMTFFLSLFYGLMIAIIHPIQLLRSEIKYGDYLCMKSLPVSSGTIYVARIISTYVQIILCSFLPSMAMVFLQKSSLDLLLFKEGIILKYSIGDLVILFAFIALFLSTILINVLYFFDRKQFKMVSNLVSLPILPLAFLNLNSNISNKFKSFLFGMEEGYINNLSVIIAAGVFTTCVLGYFWFIRINIYRFYRR